MLSVQRSCRVRQDQGSAGNSRMLCLLILICLQGASAPHPIQEEDSSGRPVVQCWAVEYPDTVRCSWKMKRQPLHNTTFITSYWHGMGSKERQECIQSPLKPNSCTISDFEMFSIMPYVLNVTVVTALGSASTLYPFIVEEIIKPDPPENVTVSSIHGQANKLHVRWDPPKSWPLPQHFPLKYMIRYKRAGARAFVMKYYPPDFDPSKIPKLKLPKDRQYVVRLMAPFNMRCKTCGEYIYKGKKFNARKETVQNELYLGLPIFRFYIKCTRCLAEITFKTDPENTDYAMEHGATRNFQAEKLIEEDEKRQLKEREEEELNNPMKVLENRTKDSKLEMEVLENLQELKELNQRQACVDFESMLQKYKDYEEEMKRREQEDDEREMKMMMELSQKRRCLQDSDSDEEVTRVPAKAAPKSNPTDILSEKPATQIKKMKIESWERSVGKLSCKPQLSGLVVVKKQCEKQGEPIRNGTHLGHVLQKPDTGVMSKSEVRPSEPIASCAVTPSASSLSMLGAYSDSESNSD